jgi:hypothetical protein
MSATNSNSTARVYDALAGRNRIINGDCRVAQRASLVCSNTVSGYGGPDRFLAGNTAGGQFTQSYGTITYGGVTLNAVVQTVNTALASVPTGDLWTGIQHRIEGYNAYDLIGQPVMISFIFNTNVTGTYSISLADGAAAYTYVATFAATANTPTKVVIPVTALPSTLTVPNTASVGLYLSIGGLTATGGQTSTLNTWQSGNYGSATTATNWAATANNFISLTNLQLEAGTIATQFEREAVSITLAKCQRYFWLYAAPSVDLQGMHTNTTTGYVFGLFFPVQMRSTPTATLAGTWQWTNSAGQGGTITANAQSASQYYLAAASTATAASTFSSGYISTGAGATLSFSAEL